MTSRKGNAAKANGGGTCEVPTPSNALTSVGESTTVCFPSHQEAAMAVLICGARLKRNEGKFLGGMAFDANPPTEKQGKWLSILLDRHGLPPLEVGVAA